MVSTRHVCRSLCIGFCGAALCLVSAADGQDPPRAALRPASGPAAGIARSKHYDVRVEGLDARDVGAMLEALHAQLTKFFGLAPQGRLSVVVCATRERYVAALKADGQHAPDAGGYYCPANRKAYLWVQPSEYFTRQLILHEATHQFHYLAASGNRRPSAGWYEEGLAEYFGMHNWDGATLWTGVVPAITLEDYPARALRYVDASRAGLERTLTAESSATRPVAWTLVHFLMNRDAKKFRALAAKLDRREPPAGAFREVYGPVTGGLARDYRAWVRSRAQPWRIVWTSWQQRGQGIEGASGTSALAVLKDTPGSLTVELGPVGGTVRAGLVFGFKSQQDFRVFQRTPDGRLRVVRRLQRRWGPVQRFDRPAPARKGRDVLAVTIGDEAVVLQANGAVVKTLRVGGQVGLSVEAGRMMFGRVIVTPATKRRDGRPAATAPAEGFDLRIGEGLRYVITKGPMDANRVFPAGTRARTVRICPAAARGAAPRCGDRRALLDGARGGGVSDAGQGRVRYARADGPAPVFVRGEHGIAVSDVRDDDRDHGDGARTRDRGAESPRVRCGAVRRCGGAGCGRNDRGRPRARCAVAPASRRVVGVDGTGGPVGRLGRQARCGLRRRNVADPLTGPRETTCLRPQE